ncbi:MAG: DUF1805 domain-containing protein [Gemmataceae bacterium]|nr:DUF1805 domain-containing protein [Gemmataceae bacterium]
MTGTIPRTTHRWLQFKHGYALGISNRWDKGQYCSLLTPAGIVGCGIYALEIPAEFNQAIAIARGTPACPLVEPEDLFEAKIIAMTPRAASMGITVGMTGREAVEKMQLAIPPAVEEKTAPGIQVKTLDHVTLVVKDLAASRQFYVGVLGMREVQRPAFSFAGLWFQAGKTQIHLILEYEGSSPAGNFLPPEQRHARCQHFAFEVDDAAATLPLLQKAGVTILGGPKPRPDGYIQVFITDPDGHIVELCSPAPR